MSNLSVMSYYLWMGFRKSTSCDVRRLGADAHRARGCSYRPLSSAAVATAAQPRLGGAQPLYTGPRSAPRSRGGGLANSLFCFLSYPGELPARRCEAGSDGAAQGREASFRAESTPRASN